MIRYLIASILLLLPGTTVAHFFDGEDQRINFTGEGYPYRAVGRLTRETSHGGFYVCTAFLTGSNEITTARHCLVDRSTGRYIKEIFFELPNFLTRSKQTYYRIRVRVPQYGKRWKFETDGAVALSFDSGPDGARLGDLVGYFGVSGLDSRRDGYAGDLPSTYSSNKKRDFCNRETKEYRPLEWLYDYGESQTVKGEEWTATPKQLKTIVKLCSAGIPGSISKSNWLLMVEHSCGLGGALFDGIRSTCWTCPGMSGGPLFYYEDRQYYAIAVHTLSYPTVLNARGISKSPNGRFLVGEPFGPSFFNWAALIIPDVFRWVANLQERGFYALRDVPTHHPKNRRKMLSIFAHPKKFNH